MHCRRAQIDLSERYLKQTYRNRCECATANGRIALSVPVHRPHGRETKMKDIAISNAENWRKDHLKAIESGYRNTPYYLYYIDELRRIVQMNVTYLHQLNTQLTLFLIDKVGLTVSLEMTTAPLPLQPMDDLRVEFTPKRRTQFRTHRYIQAFEERHGFIHNLSMLDLLFNEGPNSLSVLRESAYVHPLGR